MTYVIRYFFGKNRTRSLNHLAKESGVYKNTVSTQMAAINNWFKDEIVSIEINGVKEKRRFPGMDRRIMTEIDNILKDAGYVENEANLEEKQNIIT